MKAIILQLNKHFRERYADSVRAFNSGKVSEDQLQLFIHEEKPVIESIRIAEKKIKHEQRQKELAKIKSNNLSDNYLKELKNQLVCLNYEKKEIEKQKPKLAPAIKAKETRLKNISNEIEYTEKLIKTFELIHRHDCRLEKKENQE